MRMKQILFTLTLLLPSVARAQGPAQGAPQRPAERELRAALCDVDRRDYQSAQRRLEQLLSSDPKNIYAQKLLPWAAERQIKPGDSSPGNLALVRRALELYRRAAQNPTFTAEDRSGADKHVLLLYGLLGEVEERDELLRRVSDYGRPAKERSNLYVVLASRSWLCSYQVTMNRSTPGGPAVEGAKKCVAAGLDYASRAIALNAVNESAWAYKAYLLKEGSALAGIEKDQRLRILYRREADEAERRAKELSVAEREAQEREQASQDEEWKKRDQFTAADALKATRELTEFKDENSLDEVVKEVFSVPGSALELMPQVPPIPITDEKTERAATPEEKTEGADAADSQPEPEGCFPERRGGAQLTDKREWKHFTPAGREFTAELPDNVCARGGDYVAASEGVRYLITTLPGPAVSSDPAVIDAVLNTMARGFVGFRSGAWVSGGWGRSFELKFVRKEYFGGHPRKVYAYALISCSERKEGVLAVQAGGEHYFMFDVSGAAESDPRAQRFFKSLVFLR